jgi:anaerobic selenocysteine-containing dehydrogenase
VSEKLSELKTAGTPEQLLVVDSREKGTGMELVREFTRDFGSPNFCNAYNPNAEIAATIWGDGNTDVIYDLENAHNIFCFGAPVFESGNNPVYYAVLRHKLSGQTEGHKGNFYIIDPRLSASAAKAEHWVPIKPNTYGLLALGMLNLIIKEELYDVEAVNELCVGFEDITDRRGQKTEGFKSRVLRTYIPSFVSEKTGVPVDQIIALARSFATSSNAIAIAGDVANQTVDGVYQIWAIMALNAITGKFNKPGGIGNFDLNPFKASVSGKTKGNPLVSSTPGQFPFQSGSGSIESLPEKILSNSPYPVKLAIFNNFNPIYNSPRSSRFRQAFQNIPFSIVFSGIHNETTPLADMILPDCTFLEKNDLFLPASDFSNPVVGMTQPVVEPLFESRQTEDVILALGRNLLAGNWKKGDSYRSHIRSRMEELYNTNTGSTFSDEFKVSFDSLLAERGWRRRQYKDFDDFVAQVREVGGWWDPSKLRERQQGRFSTRIGKFYLDSKSLKDRYKGSSGQFRETMRIAGFEIGDKSEYMLGAKRIIDDSEHSQYPLALYIMEHSTTRGNGGILNGMADMVGHYEYIKWRSWVELNPETAHALGLHDRQMVWVESANGKQKLLLVLNPGLMPEVAAVPAGLGRAGSYSFGENITDLLSKEREIFTGMSAISETSVKIYA